MCEDTISTGSSNSAKSSILRPKNSENATPVEATKKSTPLDSSPKNPPNNKSLESDDSHDLKGTTDNADIQSKAVDTVGDKSKFSVNHSHEGSDNFFSYEMAKSKCRPNKKSKRRGKHQLEPEPSLALSARHLPSGVSTPGPAMTLTQIRRPKFKARRTDQAT
jgi:hypothetical protein